MARLVMIVLAATALVLAACGAQAPTAPPPSQATSVEGVAAPSAPQGAPVSCAPGEAARAEAVVPAPNAAVEAGGSNAGDSANAPAEGNQLQYGLRMVIMTANLAMEVESVDQAEAQLRNIVDRAGGYLLRVRTTGEGERKTSYIAFRVPSERFAQVLADTEALAKRVINRTIDGMDVTEEFVDLESRLRNLEATRDRITAMLQRAVSLEETLRLNQALTEVQGQIEQVKGRMRYLDQNSTYSTITVELHPLPLVANSPQSAPQGWNLGKVLSDQIALLLGFFQNVLTIVMVIIVWAPVWFIPVLLIIWFWRVQQKAVYGEQRSEARSSDASTKRFN